MKTLFLLLFGLLTANATLLAQGVYSDAPNTYENQLEISQRLNVNCDARLEEMLGWHIQKNEYQEGMEGFRVEVYFSSEIDAKDQAIQLKTDFLKKHPEYPVHIMYVSPNFRVRIGDFRTKNEALKLYKLIQNDYPAAFIVPDIIDFPLLKPNKI